MKQIVAIGGGDIKNRGIKKLDDYLFSLDKTKHVLLIPTAGKEKKEFIDSFIGIYEKEYNAQVRVLYMKDQNKEELFSWASIIYVSGGDTSYMLEEWKRNKVDSLLWKAYNDGKILSGMSAGAICWFRYAYVDKHSYFNNGIGYNYTLIKGLDYFPFSCCPHYDEPGKESFNEDCIGIGIALDNNSLIHIFDDEYRIVSIKGNASYGVDKDGYYHLVQLKSGKLSLLHKLFLRGDENV